MLEEGNQLDLQEAVEGVTVEGLRNKLFNMVKTLTRRQREVLYRGWSSVRYT